MITRKEIKRLEDSIDREFLTIAEQNKADKIVAKLYRSIGANEDAEKLEKLCKEVDRAEREYPKEHRNG
jgi:ribosomal protein L9